MSDDDGSPAGSPQEFQPQSPQAEPDFMPESPTQSPGEQAPYDENAPVSPTAEEEEEEAAESPQRSPYDGDDNEESLEQPEHQPISPVAADEDEEREEGEEHGDYDAVGETGDGEEEENAQESSQPNSPAAAGDYDDEAPLGSPTEAQEEHDLDNMPISPVADEADDANMPVSPAMEGEEAEEERDEDSLESPTKRKRVMLDSDDEDEEKGEDKTHDGDEEEGEQHKPMKEYKLADLLPYLMPPISDYQKRVVNGELEETVDLPERDEEEGDGEKEVGDLMANIFGDESDEEGGGGRGEMRPVDDSDDDLGGGGGGGRRDDDDANMEWDFDVMLRNKKAEKKKIRRRKKDGGIDIINDDDGTIEHVVTAMKKAASDDRHSNTERQPATRKRKMLATVKAILLKSDLVETMIDGGMMSAISEWLAPLPDKSLPALEIRSELLKILQGFARLDQGVLKQSGLGKAVMMLFKHPRETKENKKLAHRLISDWARPIFQIDTDFRSMSREDRMERDLAQAGPASKRRKTSDEAGGSAGGFRDVQEDLRPGMKGYIGRARVPKISSKDYVVRPAPLVEGTFKGEKKSKGNDRLDRATRDFKERTKAMKAKRAIGVSIEGRRMEI